MFIACHLQCEVLSNPALGHSSRVRFLLPWGSLALEEFSKGTNIQEKKKQNTFTWKKKNSETFYKLKESARILLDSEFMYGL